MEKDLDRGQKKEAMDPIMMDEDHIKEIMEREGNMCTSKDPTSIRSIGKKGQ
jgi:hypothetical protein